MVVDSRSRALGNVGSSVAGTYDLIWKTLWHLKIPASAQVFFWRVLQGVLPYSLKLFVDIFFPLRSVRGAIFMLNLFFMLCGLILKPNRFGFSLLSILELEVGVLVLLLICFVMLFLF